jgi:hypothetical protein
MQYIKHLGIPCTQYVLLSIAGGRKIATANDSVRKYFQQRTLTNQRISNGWMVEIAERAWFVLLARRQHEQNNGDETGGASGMIGEEEKDVYIEGLGRKNPK